MTFRRKCILTYFLATCLSPTSYGQEQQDNLGAQSFIVKDIQIEGHRRVTLGAVLRSLPVQVGESVNASVISQAIRTLYQSGNFEDVQIFRAGDTLIVRVVERKTISSINFVDNKDLKKELLLEDLKLKGIAVGEPLNPATLHNLDTYLESIYHSLGKYSATVTINQTPSDKGTVDLEFVFIEGQTAKIAQINIIGNQSFHESELLDAIELSDFPYSIPLWNKNKYQEQMLRGDLESLRSFYMDRGYLEFKITSTQVALTPDKKGVYLTIYVDEGKPVFVDKIDMQGNFAGHKAALLPLIAYKKGEYFSAQKVADTEKAITEYLGRYGYAQPQVKTIPDLKEKGTKADLIIQVDPGNRMSVRRIFFSGNTMTDDAVLRREMRQMESTWFSSKRVELSKRRLQSLAFIKSVNIDTQRVLGEDDKVDLYVNIEETRSGTITFGVSYGLQTGPGLNVSMQQENFLGTGDEVGVNFKWNRNSQEVDLERYDPYFTVDGIGLGSRVFFSRFEAGRDNLVDYTNKSFGAQVSTGIPLSENASLRFIADAKRNELMQQQTYAQALDFWERVGDSVVDGAVARFNLFELTTKWIHDTRDSRLLPREGHQSILSLKASLPFSDLKYWKTSFENRYYYPLDRDQQWVFYNRSFVAYGNGYGGSGEEDRQLPFFENYHAGGSEFLRGFETNTVGPKALLSHDRAGRSELIATARSLGGNAIAVNSMHLIFPTPLIPENWRDQVQSALFLDFGNVWDTYYDYDALISQCSTNCNYIRNSAEPGHIRVSVGVAMQLRTPFGPMSLSLAQPLKKYDGDQTQIFDFSISNSF